MIEEISSWEKGEEVGWKKAHTNPAIFLWECHHHFYIDSWRVPFPYRYHSYITITDFVVCPAETQSMRIFSFSVNYLRKES